MVGTMEDRWWGHQRDTRGTGWVREFRQQFPEEVVTPGWELKSAGGVGVNQEKGLGECPRKKRRHVQRSCGMVASRN